MLERWRASLRIAEALAIEVTDAPRAAGALESALSYGSIDQGKLVVIHPSTAWRWVRAAVRRSEELRAIVPGRKIGTHTLRHSYARHLLMSGIQINYLSRWLGHSSTQTTLIYLELVPDPSGSLGRVPQAHGGGPVFVCLYPVLYSYTTCGDTTHTTDVGN